VSLPNPVGNNQSSEGIGKYNNRIISHKNVSVNPQEILPFSESIYQCHSKIQKIENRKGKKRLRMGMGNDVSKNDDRIEKPNDLKEKVDKIDKSDEIYNVRNSFKN
jgi:hypothetical protein